MPPRDVQSVAGSPPPQEPGPIPSASERYGRLPWRELLAGARELVEEGFPRPAACHAFLRHAHRSLHGHDPRSHAALHDEEGELLQSRGQEPPA